MTTTDHTAHDVMTRGIADHVLGCSATYAARLATALSDYLTAAGFAVVRLPEPDGHSSTGAPAWGTIPYPVYAEPNRVDLDTTPIEASDARALAAALLAAADHQEKNQ